MKITNVKMGGFLLLESISIIQYKEQEICFDVQDNTEKPLHVILQFTKNTEKKDGGFDVNEEKETNTCIVDFYNISGMGGTTTEPVGIAEYDTDKKKLFFAVDFKPKRSDEIREVVINFYTKEKEDGTGDSNE